jgi:hypothetical protein
MTKSHGLKGFNEPRIDDNLRHRVGRLNPPDHSHNLNDGKNPVKNSGIEQEMIVIMV